MKPGDKLKNGSIVIACKDDLVLAVVPNNVQPYATWKLTPGGDTFWGHYHDRLADAFSDYEARL